MKKELCRRPLTDCPSCKECEPVKPEKLLTLVSSKKWIKKVKATDLSHRDIFVVHSKTQTQEQEDI